MTIALAEAPSPTPIRPRRRIRRRVSWALVAVALVGGGAFLAAKRGRGAGADAVDTALITAAKRGQLDVTVLETGRIEPRAQAQIKARIGGQVTDVTVQEGEKVTVGQILLRLEPTDYRRDVARMTAEVEQQRLAAAYSALQLARVEKAFKSSIAPTAELDQAKHEAALARARVDAGKVALETARDRLRYTQVEAPIAGTVIQRNVNPGEVVVPGVTATFDGKPLMVIADLGTLLVKVDLNQIDIAKVKRGMAAAITVDALPGRAFNATITKVAPSAVTAAGSNRNGGGGGGLDVFPIEAELDRGQDLTEIKPGMTADVRVVVARHPDVVLLPIEAVVTEGEVSKVHVVGTAKDGPATTERIVTTGVRNDREVVITKGVTAGERVLIRPPAKPKDDKR